MNNYTIDVPYTLGTLMEERNNSDNITRICYYKYTRKGLYVGITTKWYERNAKADIEITVNELMKKWKETERVLIGKFNPRAYKRIYTNVK